MAGGDSTWWFPPRRNWTRSGAWPPTATPDASRDSGATSPTLSLCGIFKEFGFLRIFRAGPHGNEDSVVTRYGSQTTNQYNSSTKYRIITFFTESSKIENREGISTLRYNSPSEIATLCSLTSQCVWRFLTPSSRILRGSNRQLEPNSTATMRAVVVWTGRPPSVIGDGDDNYPIQRLALRDWPRDDAVIAIGDLVLIFVDDFSSRRGALNN
jgi:hypothetical protein